MGPRRYISHDIMTTMDKASISNRLVSMPRAMPDEAALVNIIGTIAKHAEDVDREAKFPDEAIGAIRELKLLSAAVPNRFGGMGASLVELSEICEQLGRACASTGMIYAMHCIQVFSIVDHMGGNEGLADYLYRLVDEQRLIASVTSEVGTSGDLRRSICGVETIASGEFLLEKSATTISYGSQADDLLLTARRSTDAAANDQVCALLLSGQYELGGVGNWDTLGMRGTCSPPARISGSGEAWQILPDPFRDIASTTMVPVSHILWASVWLGIAADASTRARRFLQMRSRKDSDGSILASNRLTRVSTRVSSVRSRQAEAARTWDTITRGNTESADLMATVLAINELKLEASEAVTEVVGEAMQVIGIPAYQNQGEWSLGRQLRDAHSASLMINNDRIRATNAELLLVYKGR